MNDNVDQQQPRLTPEQTLERRKLWFDFGKFFLASVVVALIGQWFAQVIKERETAIKEHETLAKEAALHVDRSERIKFAEYYKYLTRDDRDRARWAEYYDVLVGQEKRERDLATQIADARKSSDTASKAKIKDLEFQQEILKKTAEPVVASPASSPGKIQAVRLSQLLPEGSDVKAGQALRIDELFTARFNGNQE